MMSNIDLARAYITALTGNANSVIDWRCIHDTNKGDTPHCFRGSLDSLYTLLNDYNQKGYGIFCNINSLDGNGRLLEHIEYIRTHVVDLDNVFTSDVMYNSACSHSPTPTFAVSTSPNKYHVYWVVEPYKDNDFYKMQQKKLRQKYDGDAHVVDASRVLRVPGFYHLKNPLQPYLVTCWALGNINNRIKIDELVKSLEDINSYEEVSERKPLGDSSLKAPSFEMLLKSLEFTDPNDLETYADWRNFTAGFKQSGWSWSTPENLLEIWLQWCSKYAKNDVGENYKLWGSLTDTTLGWQYVEKVSGLKGYRLFGQQTENDEQNERLPELLSPDLCAKHFKNCYLIGQLGKIYAGNYRLMDATKFNALYGGHKFVIDDFGKTTDEPWKAATRSTSWTIPKVDHLRFLPDNPTFDVISDELGRKGLNIYVPVKNKAKEGDVSLFLNHMEKIVPNETDRNIIYDYMSHVVKYPGHKLFWSILIQSMEGVGKDIFFRVLSFCLGQMYVHSPNAKELASSGQKFNAWMNNKLFICVDEIKCEDSSRDLVEVLKPYISQKRIEIQGKGHDQDMQDNYTNWLFFSNYKDAIPINDNSRRFAIIFSAVQNMVDLTRLGLNDDYYNKIWNWLENQEGFEAMNYWLLNRPVEKGSLPVRAPKSSSHEEAVYLSKSPAELHIMEAIENELQGFRGGFISSIAALNRLKGLGIRRANSRTIRTILENMGYFYLGRSEERVMQEDMTMKPEIYSLESDAKISNYMIAQDYK